MKTIWLTLLMIFFFFICTAQNDKSDSLRYGGVNNSPVIDPDFAKGSDEIKRAISEDLNYLNLYEYAHSLPELYELFDSGVINMKDWKSYLYGLKKETYSYMTDTVQAIWAVEYLGLIPLQTEFFLASLNKSILLKEKYPKIYDNLIRNTPQMKGLGYKEYNYDSLVVISDIKGENTFWFFLQLEDCRLFELLENRYNRKDILILGGLNEFSSTYKTPFYLQKRKWQSIQRRLRESENDFCIKFAENMKNVTIFINDNDRNYFSGSEGTDRNKLKEF